MGEADQRLADMSERIALLEDELPPEPPQSAIDDAPALGAEGLFLARAIAELYRANGRRDIALRVERALATACQNLGIDLSEGDNLLERFRRSRR